MSKYLKCLLFISLTLVLWGCGDDEPSNSSSNAEYYVKYEATASSGYKYTIFTENGPESFVGSSFSRTCGPFKKGFKATIIAALGGNSASCNVRIYVSRKNEPFVLKANNSGGEMISVSYTIDY